MVPQSLRWQRLAAAALFGVLVGAGIWVLVAKFRFFNFFPGIEKTPWWAMMLGWSLLCIVLELLRQYEDDQRALANRKAADAAGFQFTQEVDPRVLPSWQAPHLSQADCADLSHLMVGTRQGQRVIICDFHWKTTHHGSEGMTTESHVQTIYRLAGAGAGLPVFRVEPRTKLGGFLQTLFATANVEIAPPPGTDEADLQIFQQFREQYVLSADDMPTSSGLLRRGFHRFVLAWFTQNPGWSVLGNGRDLYIHRSGVRTLGNQRLESLHKLCKLSELLSAADIAAQEAPPVQVVVHGHDFTAAVAGLLVSGVGGMLGLLLGGVLGIGGILFFSKVLQQEPLLIIVIPAFFGSGLVGAITGAFVGYRFGRRSEFLKGLMRQRSDGSCAVPQQSRFE
jgi:hypothetical protein